MVLRVLLALVVVAALPQAMVDLAMSVVPILLLLSLLALLTYDAFNWSWHPGLLHAQRPLPLFTVRMVDRLVLQHRSALGACASYGNLIRLSTLPRLFPLFVNWRHHENLLPEAGSLRYRQPNDSKPCAKS